MIRSVRVEKIRRIMIMSRYLEFEDVMADIYEAMGELDGEDIAKIHNEICLSKIKYEGDNSWVGIDKEEDKE